MRAAVAGRVLALCALAAAVIAVAVVLLTGGSSYVVTARFVNASQLVKGDEVQVSGVPVGTVTKLGLSPNGQADVTMKITSGTYEPLRRGTRFIVRLTSLSGYANRYVDLQLPPGDAKTTGTWPNHATIPATDTRSVVELDQIFNTLNAPTRQGLRDVIRGSASQYAGNAQLARVAFQYLNPAVASSAALFAELNRDTPKLRRFIVESGALVHTLAQRQNDLAGVVSNTANTTGALARPNGAVARAIQELPPFMRQANTTFVDLRTTLDTLTPLVNESKPVARKLQPFLAALRPLARDAVPTVRDLSGIIRRPGPDNDLVELTAGAVPLAKIAIGPVQANGKSRPGAFPASTSALASATPELAYARPWTVDLTGWFDDFSHSGIYDAVGGMSRVSLIVNATSLGVGPGGVPTSTLNFLAPLARTQSFLKNATLGQYDRCPGAAARPAPDGSNPYKPSADYPCDASEVPPGR